MEGRRAVRRGSVRVIAILGLAAILAVAVGAVRFTDAAANTVSVKRYNVVFEGSTTTNGFSIDGGRDAALALIRSAGGTVLNDLTKQIGVVTAVSANPAFASLVGANTNVDVVGEDFKWKAFPSFEEAVMSGELTLVDEPEPCSVQTQPCPPGGPEETQDPLEELQWSMEQIRTPQAHAIQSGSRAVQVGILDSGIDGQHLDFTLDQVGTNVDCALGRDFVPLGPGVGNPDPCIDNQFHGTHVAGIVAAQANQHGVVGVAPNVTLIPVKVCDTSGYCYSSSTAAGITYAGDAKFEVINMSFFVDDDQLLTSTEFKCMSDPVQRAFRLANERAIQYARQRGVVPVAALGNSDNDLAHPPEPYENECEVVPAETQGVIGTMALGLNSEKAGYSNYGFGMTDVAAPGGNGTTGDCRRTVLSTIPGNAWGCIQGTSMASPHAAGVAALIVSQFGRLGNDAGVPDIVMRPQEVEAYLQGTTIDLVWPDPTSNSGIDNESKGYDQCFGHGRIDALRAVLHETSYEARTVPNCVDGSAPPPPGDN
jgi:subtilisin family serine protease